MKAWDEFENFIKNSYKFSLSSGHIEKFKTYLVELIRWNKKTNLTSSTIPEEILYKHFGDSLAYLLLPSGLTSHSSSPAVADIGTGAGFPGIPLKIVYPDINLFLIESTKKKCMFLEHIRHTLKLKNIQILAERTETVAQNNLYREKFDIVLCRAVSKLPTNLELTLPLSKPEGLCIFWKAKNYQSELNESHKIANLLGGTYLSTIEYELPENISHVLLIFKKIKSTPKKYPRRIGIPEKRPLKPV